jgi:hypothetical protein
MRIELVKVKKAIDRFDVMEKKYRATKDPTKKARYGKRLDEAKYKLDDAIDDARNAMPAWR